MLRKKADTERVHVARRQSSPNAVIDEEVRSTWLRQSAALIILAAIALTAFALVDLSDFASVSWRTQVIGYLLRLIILVIAGFLAFHLVRHKDRPDLAMLKPDVPIYMPASIEELIEAERNVARYYGEEAIRYFAHTLFDLSSYLARVDEEFVLMHRSVTVKTSLTLRTIETRNLGTPGTTGSQALIGCDQRILVPVLVAERDRLIDNLAVCDASGKALPLLPRSEVRGLITAALRMFLEQQVLRLPHADSEKKLPEFAKDVLNWVLMDAVCAVGERSVSVTRDGSSEETTAQKAALDSLWQLRRLGMRAEAIRTMRYLCKVLAEQSLTVCELSPSGGVNTVVKYCYTYPSQVVVGSSYERRRAKRGLDQCRFDLVMSRALETDSYHLQFTAPESQYVYSHHLERPDGTVVRGHELVIAGVPQFVRYYHEEGRSVAHAHIRRRGVGSEIRGGNVANSQNLTSVVRVREVPPGTMSSTVLLSLVTTAVILFVTTTRIGLDGGAGSANLPALLLAIPAFLAGALGKSVDSARLGRTPMLTHYGLSATGILSFAAALLYVLDAGCDLGTQVPITLVANTLALRPDWTWTFLSIASVSVLVFLWREKKNQTGYYLDSLRNSVDRNGS